MSTVMVAEVGVAGPLTQTLVAGLHANISAIGPDAAPLVSSSQSGSIVVGSRSGPLIFRSQNGPLASASQATPAVVCSRNEPVVISSQSGTLTFCPKDRRVITTSQTEPLVSSAHTTAETTAQNAYQKAFALLKAQRTSDALKGLIAGQDNAEGVLAVVLQVGLEYDSKKKNKPRQWLASFSSRVTHYGKVLDVLVQHHPEYVSLAWGTMKLLFMLFQNHEQILGNLVSSLGDIAAKLEHIKIHEELFQDDSMQDAIVGLYTLLFRSFNEMLAFYQEGILKRAWNALAKPWELRFMEPVASIGRSVDNINQLAAALSHREQRDGARTLRRIHATQEIAVVAQGKSDVALSTKLDDITQMLRRLEQGQLVQQMQSPVSMSALLAPQPLDTSPQLPTAFQFLLLRAIQVFLERLELHLQQLKGMFARPVHSRAFMHARLMVQLKHQAADLRATAEELTASLASCFTSHGASDSPTAPPVDRLLLSARLHLSDVGNWLRSAKLRPETLREQLEKPHFVSLTAQNAIIISAIRALPGLDVPSSDGGDSSRADSRAPNMMLRTQDPPLRSHGQSQYWTGRVFRAQWEAKDQGTADLENAHQLQEGHA